MRWVGQMERLSYFEANQTHGAREKPVFLLRAPVDQNISLYGAGGGQLACNLPLKSWLDLNLLLLSHSALQTLQTLQTCNVKEPHSGEASTCCIESHDLH